MHKTFFDNVKNNIRGINLGRNKLTEVPGAGESAFDKVSTIQV